MKKKSLKQASTYYEQKFELKLERKDQKSYFQLWGAKDKASYLAGFQK